MNPLIFDLIVNSLMALLLVATIIYCFKLNVRIRVLQDSKEEFSRLIERFDATTQRAQASIEELQNMARRVDEQLAARLDKANFLADDLAFMIEKGGKIADRVEGRISGKAVPAEVPESATSRRPAAAESGAVRRKPSGSPAAEGGGAAAEDRKRAALEAMLAKSNARMPGGEDSAARTKRRPAGGPTARLRSKAEQELYDALKSGNS